MLKFGCYFLVPLLVCIYSTCYAQEIPQFGFVSSTTLQEHVVALPLDVDPEQQSAFSPLMLMSQFLLGNHSYLCETFLSKLDYLTEHTYTSLPFAVGVYIESLVQNLLYFFAQPQFTLHNYELSFIRYNDVISNLVALTSFRTTDKVLDSIIYQGGDNAAKVLVLLNPRCHNSIPYEQIRQTIPALFGPWFISWYSMAFSGLCEEQIHTNLYHHQRYLLQVNASQGIFRGHKELLPLYFAATYVDDESEPAVHAHIWDAILHYHKTVGNPYQFVHKPRKNSIALLTGPWSRDRTIVYRVYNRYLQALAREYDVTLIQLNVPVADQDYACTYVIPEGTGFQRVIYLNWFADHTIDIRPIRENDYALCFMLDIGLTMQSIHLAQLKIAPIIISGYGHPISTYGGKVDYFIGSAAAELPHMAEKYYSERLVLIPGLGVVHNNHWGNFTIDPHFDVRQVASFSAQPAIHEESPVGEIIINCPWHGQKINAPLLKLLKQVVDRSRSPLLFRFFLGSGLSTRNRYLLMQRRLESALAPARVQTFYGGIGPDDYLSLMNQAHFFVDAFPFGGVNTVMDALYLRKPFVALQGNRWISRVAAAHMRYAGTPELIAHSDDEYMSIILRLVHDVDFRRQMTQRLQAIDLNRLFFANGEERYMVDAVRFLIENHERMQASGARTPIYIPER